MVQRNRSGAFSLGTPGTSPAPPKKLPARRARLSAAQGYRPKSVSIVVNIAFHPIDYRLREQDLQVFWRGKNGNGGHKPSSQTVGKTVLPQSWTLQDYEDAIHSVVRAPEYVREISAGRTRVRGRHKGVVFEMELHGVEGRRRRITHAFPTYEDGARYDRLEGHTRDLVPFKWGRGWRRVNF